MTPLPPVLFGRLARTRPAPAATAALRAGLHARRLLLLKSLLARLDRQRMPVDRAVRERFDRHWRLLEHAELRNRAEVRAVVDYPLTGAWLAEALTAPEGPALDRHLAHFGFIAATAALRAGCDLRLTLDVPGGLLSLPGLGTLRCPAHRARLHARGRFVRITGGGRNVALLRRGGHGHDRTAGGGPGWSALRTLPGGTVVLDDLDPYRVPHRGPGAATPPAAERADVNHAFWAGLWRRSLTLIEATDPGRAAEIQAVQRALVPLAAVPAEYRGHLPMSATLRAAPGVVLSSPPAGPHEFAEVLVHETHHTKLAALHERVPLYRPGGSGLHPVGWRSDPRPVAGVLQGAYAHLALTDLWRRAATGSGSPPAWRRRAAEQFEQHRGQVGEALSVLLESDELTIEGREFAGEMSEHHACLGAAQRICG